MTGKMLDQPPGPGSRDALNFKDSSILRRRKGGWQERRGTPRERHSHSNALDLIRKVPHFPVPESLL